jgi:hypothetical protein
MILIQNLNRIFVTWFGSGIFRPFDANPTEYGWEERYEGSSKFQKGNFRLNRNAYGWRFDTKKATPGGLRIIYGSLTHAHLQEFNKIIAANEKTTA